MTLESQVARDTAINFEAKKDGLRQNQDGGCKFTVNINPDDMPLDLFKHPMGQRYVIAVVPIGDDESPLVQPEEKPKSYAQQAAMMVKDMTFIEYLNVNDRSEVVVFNADDADIWLKAACNVKSKSEIKDDFPFAADTFKSIQRDFLQWKQLNEQAAQYER